MVDVVPTEVAWAAGFFDGEGTTRYNESRSRYGAGVNRSVMASVAQADPRPLERFQAALFGKGAIRFDDRMNSLHTPMWVWYCTNWRDVQACVAAMWPFLCQPKRDQAAGALTLARQITFRPPRGSDGLQIRCKRGHDYSNVYTWRGRRLCAECAKWSDEPCVRCGGRKSRTAKALCRPCWLGADHTEGGRRGATSVA